MAEKAPAIKIIECPRDAMQGLTGFIPTDLKVEYLNKLLQVGFDTIDFGSFVSPKAIPQLRDTAEVLSQLNMGQSKSKLLAIIANIRGAEAAALYEQITYLGFPLSLSETFQQRNTNKSISEAFDQLQEIQNICKKNGKVLVTYLSMGFGNPYGDPYEMDYVEEFVNRLLKMEVEIISLADTIGASNKENIHRIVSNLTTRYEHIEFGVHLHADRDTALEKIDAAYRAGCKRFDGAINGFGGCPMADDTLVGNVATESIIHYFEQYQYDLGLIPGKLEEAMNLAPVVFLGR